MEQPIRVLQIVTYMGRGGLETMLMNYYRNIDREKIQFDFLVHRDFKADYDDEIESLGGKIYHVPQLNPFSLNYYKSLKRFFSEHKYDIVHCHLDCMSAYPLYVAKKCGVKIRIAHAHNKNQDKDYKYIIKILSRHFIYHCATDLFACGKEAGRWMFCGHEFSIMNNAIDTEKFVFNLNQRALTRRNLGVDGKFVVGHIGRFMPQKNHIFLVDIFNSVLNENTDAVLILVGTGDGISAVKERVNQLGLNDKVMFLGSRDDVNELLQAFDVFVFPSLYEGLPVTLVEAQTSGLPCVISNEVPKESIMTDSVTVCKLTDSPEYWSDCILNIKHNDRAQQFETVMSHGYDIGTNAAWLESYYTNKCGR